MKTTEIMVEFLIAGILILLSLLFCCMSWFPVELQTLFVHVVNSQSWLTSAPFLLVIFMSIAYGLGILSEFIGRAIFERMHDFVKKGRLQKYIEKCDSDCREIFDKSPILQKFKPSEPDSSESDSKRNAVRGKSRFQPLPYLWQRCVFYSKWIGEKVLRKSSEDGQSGSNDLDISVFGTMRFYVLMKSSALYEEIESQLNRLRVIRILFLVEVILLLAIVPPFFQNPSWFLGLIGFALICLAATTLRAIWVRFNRYCRALERSYMVLRLESSDN